MRDANHTLRLADALPVYVRIGLLSFGGPAAQMALMQDEIVARRGWVDGGAFQRGLNVAMLLPGPEAQQLATWLGWRLHGVAGGLAAGLAFILPGAGLMILLAWIAARYGDVGLVGAVFYGVQPAVLILVARALRALAGRAVSTPLHWALAGAAFVGIWALGLPFPLIVAAAGAAGILLLPNTGESGPGASGLAWGGPLRIIVVSLGLIVGVALAVELVFGAEPFRDVAALFTTAAFVSFGGAYALLPYVAERAVETYGWLTAAEMLNGLAIAEATPGPLILVNVYSGFYAGHSAGWGALTAALACFYTFAPSFMLILAAAPYVEAMQSVRWIRRALAGVSAAVVGVILNLTVYLGEAALFPDGLTAAPAWPKLALLVALVALSFVVRLGMMQLVCIGAAAGLALHAAGLI
ncbi:MAG: chromate efflux transporter [Pseudomonadota bacterium]